LDSNGLNNDFPIYSDKRYTEKANFADKIKNLDENDSFVKKW
jgi:hypothetical protein